MALEPGDLVKGKRVRMIKTVEFSEELTGQLEEGPDCLDYYRVVWDDGHSSWLRS